MPDQELYDEAFSRLLDDGLDVHDVIPEFKTIQTPYIYFGQSQYNPTPTKVGPLATVALTINVWGSRKQRRKVAQLTSRLFLLLESINRTAHYTVDLDPHQTVNTVFEDSEDNAMLWHGQIDVTYKIM